MSKLPFEIERKYLIKKPDEEFLNSVCQKKLKISQTYLVSDIQGFSQRVRRIFDGNETSYIMTEKKDITAIKRIEFERNISEKEYNQLILHKKAPVTSTIEKTRYVINHGKFNFEIDLFDLWQDYALMEIELESQEEQFDFCDFMSFAENVHGNTKIVILKEVTQDKKYRNFSLAKGFPKDIL